MGILATAFSWASTPTNETLHAIVDRMTARTGLTVSVTDHGKRLEVRFEAAEFPDGYDVSILRNEIHLGADLDTHPYLWHHLVRAAVDLGAIPKYGPPRPRPELDTPWRDQPRWRRAWLSPGSRRARAMLTLVALPVLLPAGLAINLIRRRSTTNV